MSSTYQSVLQQRKLSVASAADQSLDTSAMEVDTGEKKKKKKKKHKKDEEAPEEPEAAEAEAVEADAAEEVTFAATALI